MAANWGVFTKVLKLELEKGCKDTAVIGGLNLFLVAWLEQEFPESMSQKEEKLVTALKCGVAKYPSMSPAKRKAWLNSILNVIEKGQPIDNIEIPAALPIGKPKSPKKRPVIKTSGFSLESPSTSIDGVSIRMAEKLSKLGINTIRDMLYFFPHRHLNYSHLKTISQLTEGKEETILANIWESRVVNIKGRRSTEATLGDNTGNIRAVWFNNPYLSRQLTGGKRVVLSGRVRFFNNRPAFESPDWEFFEEQEALIHTGRLVPVYPLTKGVYQRQLRKIIRTTVNDCLDLLVEFLPEHVLTKNKMLSITDAVKQAHFPDSLLLKDQARIRLAFDELFLLQLGVLRKKAQWQVNKTLPITSDDNLLTSFTTSLPFTLTTAQARVIQEIMGDLKQPHPMSRLLQGEVGSGKTVVALVSLLMAVSASRQCAFMAPTEILAQQHFKAVIGLLTQVGVLVGGEEPLKEFGGICSKPVTIALLTSDIKNSTKKRLKDGIKTGSIDIIIGTHAIFQEEVIFKDLGLAVIDEQHRFGVVQRQALRQKGNNPHILVMTATPIPRTLALTMYGDLDISIIDEVPPGRQIIKTRWLKPSERYKAYNFIRKQVSEGRQAFIICPLIEDSDTLQAKAATVEFERLSREVFTHLKLGLLHGRMKALEKESMMREFYQGKLDVLISTPVVEVGIDVPNATVMLIESANRFGLSQLHQFRGRVGRGKHQSYCMLMTETASELGAERLKAIEELHDGFKLAEKDLELRGPGEFFGTRQSGLPDLKMAKLSDMHLLERARDEASKVFAYDPGLSHPDHHQLTIEMSRIWPQEESERS